MSNNYYKDTFVIVNNTEELHKAKKFYEDKGFKVHEPHFESKIGKFKEFVQYNKHFDEMWSCSNMYNKEMFKNVTSEALFGTEFKSMYYKPISKTHFDFVITNLRSMGYIDSYYERTYDDMIKSGNIYINTDTRGGIFYRNENDKKGEPLTFAVSDDQRKVVVRGIMDEAIIKTNEINFEEPFFKKFLPFKKDKPMTTLAQEIFDRFLKSNKTKVIEAVEKAEEIQNEITPLLKPFNELAVELATNKKNLERAFDNQDKEQIKFYLKELQEINSIFDDKLFDQLKTILKAINKSLSL